MKTEIGVILVSLFLSSTTFSAPKCSDQDLEDRARHLSNALVVITETADGPVELISSEKSTKNHIKEHSFTFRSGKLTSFVVMNAYGSECSVNQLKTSYAY